MKLPEVAPERLEPQRIRAPLTEEQCAKLRCVLGHDLVPDPFRAWSRCSRCGAEVTDQQVERARHR